MEHHLAAMDSPSPTERKEMTSTTTMIEMTRNQAQDPAWSGLRVVTSFLSDVGVLIFRPPVRLSLAAPEAR